MPLPTAARVLPLARQRQLVPELAQTLAQAEECQDLPRIRLLEEAVALARQLEESVWQTGTTDPPPETADHLLENMLALSMELGGLLRQARDQS